MNNGKERVKLSKVIQKMNLVNLTPDIDVKGIWIHVPEFNRPAEYTRHCLWQDRPRDKEHNGRNRS